MQKIIPLIILGCARKNLKIEKVRRSGRVQYSTGDGTARSRMRLFSPPLEKKEPFPQLPASTSNPNLPSWWYRRLPKTVLFF